ncbi:ABC transporter ATP-binding protein [Brachybacterium sp. J144]|uniref:ABC transporter ATP-binding protein n=1 Tax=unclassified Brachybacterium TaxID=2623841 RepID=UPI002E77005C|nr:MULTISPECIES: ABC transporter ATP-binding protein [unclassified Brachybacterium]MEE1619342.1 ABC transporter ATP-binding protein [Brachybacterium sp. J153]MEE1651475.1 ABC transporter ATP-binding protein [Brachybacterium sp. J144]
MTSSTPALDLRGVRRTYGPVTAVDHLDLTVPRGQILALLGPNGAGKSTTAEMMLGLATPSAGTVRVLGVPPAEAARRGLIGAMLQNGTLLEDVPVRLLLRLVAAVCAHPLPIDDVVERADIAPLLRRNTSKLSGGEAQRVRFALALLPDPEVILLDEPTVAMDVGTRHRFWESMRAVAVEGRTIVFATHYLEEADQQADRVVVMRAGRLVADGTGAEIKERIGGRVVTLALGSGATGDDLERLPGVGGTELLEDGRIRLATSDSDATLAALFAPGGPDVRDVLVGTPSLEDAFLQLTTRSTS